MLLTLLSNNTVIGTQLYPITASDLQDDLRLADDELARLTPEINSYIAAVVPVLEHRLNRKLMTQTVVRKFDCFARTLNLTIGGVQSITSITYLDCDGVRQTLSASDYLLDSYISPCLVRRAIGASWPATYAQENNIEVMFVAGYGDHTAVPDQAKIWLRAAVQKLMQDCDGNGELPVNFMNGLVQSLKVYA